MIVEVLTSMQRHGIRADDLAAVGDHLGAITAVEGWTIHLPLLDRGRYLEAERLARAALAAAPGTLWLSHLPAGEATTLAKQLGGAGQDPSRCGSGSAPGSGSATPAACPAWPRCWTCTPYAVATGPATGSARSSRRRLAGDHGRRHRPRHRHGGSHLGRHSCRQRLVALAQGGLQATGLALSPYTIAGAKRWFLEPPHMQASLVLLPAR